jgi:hypothetical protein
MFAEARYLYQGSSISLELSTITFCYYCTEIMLVFLPKRKDLVEIKRVYSTVLLGQTSISRPTYALLSAHSLSRTHDSTQPPPPPSAAAAAATSSPSPPHRRRDERGQEMDPLAIAGELLMDIFLRLPIPADLICPRQRLARSGHPLRPRPPRQSTPAP